MLNDAQRAQADALEAPTPSRDAARSSTQRSMASRTALIERGGALKQIRLESGDLVNLQLVKDRHKLKSDADAVSWALQLAAKKR